MRVLARHPHARGVDNAASTTFTRYTARMNTTPKAKPRKRVGYKNVRISTAAHDKILRAAIENRRTFTAQLDIEMGV